MGNHAALLLFALVLDWFAGDPKWLWSRLPHPVAGFGKAIAVLDNNFNNSADTPAIAMRRGALVISSLIIASVGIGLIFNRLISFHNEIGWLVEVLIIFVFLAQKSLLDHVGEVASALREQGLDGGRKAISTIVGRDLETLDEGGVSRAAIESLAENFCDAVVAPAFWYLAFGLPGLLAYKMINTADSMIAHRNQRYLHFGRAAAKIDDLANWLPARFSALLIALAGAFKLGLKSGKNAISISQRDAGLHRSPNAGWPEAAMAGALNIALGGPRIYGSEKTSQAFINGTGKRDLNAGDVRLAMGVFSFACYALWGLVLIWFILS